MKRITLVFSAVAFALAGTSALANQAEPKSQPVQMNDAQLEAVAAGAVQEGLVNVNVEGNNIPVRVLTNSINGNTVQVPVAANVNAVVGLLGNAAGLARQFGRQN